MNKGEPLPKQTEIVSTGPASVDQSPIIELPDGAQAALIAVQKLINGRNLTANNIRGIATSARNLPLLLERLAERKEKIAERSGRGGRFKDWLRNGLSRIPLLGVESSKLEALKLAQTDNQKAIEKQAADALGIDQASVEDAQSIVDFINGLVGQIKSVNMLDQSSVNQFNNLMLQLFYDSKNFIKIKNSNRRTMYIPKDIPEGFNTSILGSILEVANRSKINVSYAFDSSSNSISFTNPLKQEEIDFVPQVVEASNLVSQVSDQPSTPSAEPEAELATPSDPNAVSGPSDQGDNGDRISAINPEPDSPLGGRVAGEHTALEEGGATDKREEGPTSPVDIVLAGLEGDKLDLRLKKAGVDIDSFRKRAEGVKSLDDLRQFCNDFSKIDEHLLKLVADAIFSQKSLNIGSSEKFLAEASASKIEKIKKFVKGNIHHVLAGRIYELSVLDGIFSDSDQNWMQSELVSLSLRNSLYEEGGKSMRTMEDAKVHFSRFLSKYVAENTAKSHRSFYLDDRIDVINQLLQSGIVDFTLREIYSQADIQKRADEVLSGKASYSSIFDGQELTPDQKKALEIIDKFIKSPERDSVLRNAGSPLQAFYSNFLSDERERLKNAVENLPNNPLASAVYDKLNEIAWSNTQ